MKIIAQELFVLKVSIHWTEDSGKFFDTIERVNEVLASKYESVELIGEGGDGRVYKCQRVQRVTAVKTLVALDLASQRRFLSEADILLRIDHENIVKVFELVLSDDAPISYRADS